jgi:GAF domain-containing protein
MSSPDVQLQLSPETARGMLELVEVALVARSLDGLVGRILSNAARVLQSPFAFLYIDDPRLATPVFSQKGLPVEAVSAVEGLCAQYLPKIVGRSGLPSEEAVAFQVEGLVTDLAIFPLQAEEGCFGLIGLSRPTEESVVSPGLLAQPFRLLANAISRLVERGRAQRQLAHLNTHLTMSSALAQSMDLPELLGVALYCCMEAVSAEGASIMLLDDEQGSFSFYHVEGPAQPVLVGKMTFPADHGLAGAVLRSQQAEVINDVQGDPRFFRDIDAESGFVTRSMIAIPLTAGDERVGVLEVLNKAGGASFAEEERVLLQSVADEIAFAIRNARVFEFLANAYCKQRQGQASCEGCPGPLSAWPPCARYREGELK